MSTANSDKSGNNTGWTSIEWKTIEPSNETFEIIKKVLDIDSEIVKRNSNLLEWLLNPPAVTIPKDEDES